MKTKFLLFVLASLLTEAAVTKSKRYIPIQDRIKAMGKANGFKVTTRVANAVTQAAKKFKIPPLKLAAIGIVETGLGKYDKTNHNKNGTKDYGLFQINTLNVSKCKEFKIHTPEGSAMCAAKLLSKLQIIRPEDIAKYHSKTPSKKLLYFSKIKKVLQVSYIF